MEPQRAKCVLEAALLTALEPLASKDLQRMFDGALELGVVESLLVELAADWRERGLELVCVKAGWRFQSRENYKRYLEMVNPEKPPKYSRATLETLAIVAYRQPVTRGDIEVIRGVTVSSPVMKALEDRGWIETVGHRETPGRPALWATTAQFLADLNLPSLADLPALEDDSEKALADNLQRVISFDQETTDNTDEDEQRRIA